MIERAIYECEFCHRKRLINKSEMKQHEDKCWYNPKNKTCITCALGDIKYKPDTEKGYIKVDKRVCNCPLENIKFDNLIPKVNCKYWEQSEI